MPSQMSGQFRTCALNSAEVRNMVVIRCFWMAAFRACASSSVSLSRIARAAPAASGLQHSNVKASNDELDACAITSAGDSGAYQLLSTRRQIDWCSTMTPLGAPVDPDVYMT